MNQIYFTLTLLFLSLQSFAQTPSQDYLQITGQVTAKDTNEPLAFAHIGLRNSSIGSVTNIEGKFVLKVPSNQQKGILEVSYLGHEAFGISLEEIPPNETLQIKLEASEVSLATVEVRAGGALSIVKEALEKVPDNYPTQAVLMEAFYREQLRENEKFVILSEAVCEVRKSSYQATYSKKSEKDQVRLIKSRKGEGLIDPEIAPFTINGGPLNGLEADIVRNPDGPLKAKNFKFYDFELTGISTYNGHEVYVIEFDQKGGIKKSLFRGNIYIELESMAIVSAEAQLSEKGLVYHKIPGFANRLILKVMGIQYAPLLMGYKIDYQQYQGKWHLNFVDYHFHFKLDCPRKDLSSVLKANVSLLVTEVHPERFATPIREEEQFGKRDELMEELGEYDADFWKDYNYILSDEALEENVKELK